MRTFKNLIIVASVVVAILVLVACTGPVGPAGAKGDQGPPGDQGQPGALGAQGPEGSRGLQGETGQQGPVGAVGPQGDIGPTGPEGPTGAVGQTGPQGEQGPAGQRGEQGLAGSAGRAGDRGEKGDPGPEGPQGIAGVRGEAGVPGPAGPRGAAGPQGEPGLTGPEQTTVDAAREQTVCVETRDAEGWFLCATGFYIDDQGTVVTAQHVVEDMLQIIVINHEDVALDYEIQSIRHDLDAAILAPKDTTVRSTPVEIASDLRDGQPVFTIGYPATVYDESYQLMNMGNIAAVFDTVSFAAIPAAPGASGSPVFDLDGRAVAYIDSIDRDGGPFTYLITLAGKRLTP